MIRLSVILIVSCTSAPARPRQNVSSHAGPGEVYEYAVPPTSITNNVFRLGLCKSEWPYREYGLKRQEWFLARGRGFSGLWQQGLASNIDCQECTWRGAESMIEAFVRVTATNTCLLCSRAVVPAPPRSENRSTRAAGASSPSPLGRACT